MTTKKMTPMERISAVLKGEPPDRVPFLITSREFGLHYAGFKHHQAYEDPKIYIESQLRLLEDFEMDGVWDIWCTPAVDAAIGAKMEIPDDDPPWISAPLLEESSGLGKLKVVDPQKDGYMPYLLDVVHGLKEAVGPAVPVIAWASPPFRTGCMIRGNTSLYLDIYDDPTFVKDLMEFTLECCTAYGKALIDAGADIITTSNPVANYECISLDAFKEFAHPYSVRMFNALKDHGAMAISFHTCGNWDDRYDLCVEGVDLLHCDKVDLAEFCPKYADDVVIMGNVRSVDTMLRSTPEAVRKESLECLKKGAPSMRYIMSNDCAIPRDTNPANVKAMRDVVREFGDYPLKF